MLQSRGTKSSSRHSDAIASLTKLEAVFAKLVFLNLLECHRQTIALLCLGHSSGKAPFANIRADDVVECIDRPTRHGARREGKSLPESCRKAQLFRSDHVGINRRGAQAWPPTLNSRVAGSPACLCDHTSMLGSFSIASAICLTVLKAYCRSSPP